MKFLKTKKNQFYSKDIQSNPDIPKFQDLELNEWIFLDTNATQVLEIIPNKNVPGRLNFRFSNGQVRRDTSIYLENGI